MNTTTSAKRYGWNGQVWSASGDEAVSDKGNVVAIAALLRAIYDGQAHEIRYAMLVPAPAVEEPKAGDMDEAGRARAEAKIAKAAEMGVKLPSSQKDGLYFDVGTAVMPEAWASERKAYEQLPAGAEALPKVRDQIRAEDRENFEYRAWDLRMSTRTGKLGDPADPQRAWEPTRRGLQGFCSRAGIGAIPEHWPTDIKAQSINALCKRFAETRPDALLSAGEDPRVLLRVQKARGRAFATVSPSYGAFDGDLVLEALLQALPREARVNVDYDPDQAKGRVEIVTLQEERPVVGEPFKTSFTVGWDDTGGGSVWGDGGLWSARCLNLTRIWTSVGTFRIRHAGAVRKLARRFREEFDRIAAVVSKFSAAYGHAAAEELTNAEKVEAHEFVQGIYRSLLQRDLVPVRGRREEAASALTMQFLADENKAGVTRAGIANGITRMAHRGNRDPWLRDDLERAAGRILWSPRPVKLDYLAKEAAAA